MSVAYSLGSVIGELLTVKLFGIKIAAGMVEWGLLLGAIAFIFNVMMTAMGYASVKGRVTDFLSSVVTGPIIEEIIYRLIMISAFTFLFDSVLIAIIISAVLFALGHVLWGGMHFLTTFIQGMVWGWALVTFGIGVPIVAHMTHNFLCSVT